MSETRANLARMTGAQHEVLIPYDMNGGLASAQVGDTFEAVPSGGNACVSWPRRQVAGTYEWFVTVSDGISVTEGPTWSFTSDGSCFDAADCVDGDAFIADQCVAGLCDLETDS